MLSWSTLFTDSLGTLSFPLGISFIFRISVTHWSCPWKSWLKKEGALKCMKLYTAAVHSSGKYCGYTEQTMPGSQEISYSLLLTPSSLIFLSSSALEMRQQACTLWSLTVRQVEIIQPQHYTTTAPHRHWPGLGRSQEPRLVWLEPTIKKADHNIYCLEGNEGYWYWYLVLLTS